MTTSTAGKSKVKPKDPVEETDEAVSSAPPATITIDERAKLERAFEHARAALAGAGEAPVLDEPLDLSTGDRLDLFEAALTSGLNLNLAQFDPQSVVDARAAALREFTDTMAALAEKAAADISEPLTTEQRVERLEAVAASRGITL